MNNKRIVTLGSILAVVIIGILFYIDRVGTPGTGTITISGASEGSTIFLDNKRHSRIRGDGELSIKNLGVGTHTIVVAKDGYWPWSKKLTITNKERVTLSTFAIPQEPAQAVLTKNNGNYETVLEKLNGITVPSAERPLSSVDGKVTIWSSQNAIWAQWDSAEDPPAAFCITGVCENLLEVFPANEVIRGLAFFPGRNDILLFSSTNGIFAIEIDKRGTQNFQPLYLSPTPTFVIVDTGTLAVRDGNTILLIRLQ